ncbi:hypothetical protein EYF80_031029 [Liparis tanakae]|uniref:Uncharacterized protein n=1 Tax=Liparis tanakae TaxID=230148 RepID=A0A4Z2H1T8_9TELE|nr:hypothetical protein EYF80_031029 [Liparis tanakae]
MKQASCTRRFALTICSLNRRRLLTNTASLEEEGAGKKGRGRRGGNGTRRRPSSRAGGQAVRVELLAELLEFLLGLHHDLCLGELVGEADVTGHFAGCVAVCIQLLTATTALHHATLPLLVISSPRAPFRQFLYFLSEFPDDASVGVLIDDRVVDDALRSVCIAQRRQRLLVVVGRWTHGCNHRRATVAAETVLEEEEEETGHKGKLERQ